MKKSLIAIAALAATGAFAQSAVTISGRLDAGFAGYQTSTIATRGIVSGLFNANYLQFKGVEDMGAGSKANVLLEMQPSTTDGSTSSALFSRGAWVGLQGGWGELRVGRQGTNTMTAILTGDLLGATGGFLAGGLLASGAIANSVAGAGAWFAAQPTRGLMAGTTATKPTSSASLGADSTRYQAAARYSLPTLVQGLGINVTTAYGGTTTDGANQGGQQGFDASYGAGPLAVALSYQHAAAETATGVTGSLTTLGANYNAGVAKFGFAYQREGAAGGTDFTAGKSWALSAQMPLGALAPYVRIGNHSYSNNTGSGLVAQMANVGTTYNLSKNTFVYADYVRNGANPANYGGINNPKQLAIGMSTSF